MTEAGLIWTNGALVADEYAKVHVLMHALHYGTGVFEGVRAYETLRGTGSSATPTTSTGSSNSARTYYMDIPYSKEEIRAATHEVIAWSGLSRDIRRSPTAAPARWASTRSTARSTSAIAVGRCRPPRRRGQVTASARNSLPAQDLRRRARSWSPRPSASTSTRCSRRSSRRRPATRRVLLGSKTPCTGNAGEGTGQNLFVIPRRRDRDPR